MKQKKLINIKEKNNKTLFKTFSIGLFWFSVGGILGLFFLISFTFILFQKMYSNVVYPGVMVNNIDFGGKDQEFVKKFFAQKNKAIEDTTFVFKYDENLTTTISAKEINYGYDENLLANQVYSIGRSSDPLSNISLIFQAYIHGVNLDPSYHFSEEKMEQELEPIAKAAFVEPVDALFNFKEGKVSAFRPSSDGQKIDLDEVKKSLRIRTFPLLLLGKPRTINISLPIQVLKPKVTTNKVNNLGIKELVANGTSLFQHSIPGRIYNVTLAATRLNGVLIAPNEVFSFNKAVGDISSTTGYRPAYIIQNGRTVLGDGGGVCQVSTTLFRAALNAGLPIIERHAHAYRVGYYEQDSLPGLDATVYSPSVDLKFKNDTSNYLLVQTTIDPDIQRLTFMLYGTKDNRQVTLGKSVITSQIPPLAPLYQDDPALPKGVISQVDFEAWGANAYFTREVRKNGKVTISEKFVSNYQPWRAIFLKGTKE